MGVITVRVTKAVFEAAGRQVRAGHFKSDYQLNQVALRQAASARSILTPGTLARLPPSEGLKKDRAETYLPNDQDEFVRRQLRGRMDAALAAWVLLVDQGVPAPGTTAFMVGHVHRGPAPRIR